MLRYVLLLITKAKGILGEENTNEPQLSLHYCHGCIFQLKEISLRVGTKRHYTGPKKPLIRRVCLVKSVLSNYESASFQFKASESRFTGRASLPPLPPPLPPPSPLSSRKNPWKNFLKHPWKIFNEKEQHPSDQRRSSDDPNQSRAIPSHP